MTVWEARGSSSEKVIFLFSINGSKKFCGAAEMSSEWNREVDAVVPELLFVGQKGA